MCIQVDNGDIPLESRYNVEGDFCYLAEGWFERAFSESIEQRWEHTGSVWKILRYRSA